jgi:hypothetical protein
MRVSLHSLSRYRERIETDCAGNDDEITGKILAAYANSRPVQLRSVKERISKLLRHKTKTDYRQHGEMVLVVSDDVVISLYLYDRARWQPVK